MSALTLTPRLSEKTYQLAQSQNTYVFSVPLTANQKQIADAVSEQFKVSVVGVNTAVRRGKVKSSVRRRQQPKTGQENDRKLAYVKIKAGDKIPLFEEA